MRTKENRGEIDTFQTAQISKILDKRKKFYVSHSKLPLMHRKFRPLLQTNSPLTQTLVLIYPVQNQNSKIHPHSKLAIKLRLETKAFLNLLTAILLILILRRSPRTTYNIQDRVKFTIFLMRKNVYSSLGFIGLLLKKVVFHIHLKVEGEFNFSNSFNWHDLLQMQ
jgi:hypothetical protein